MTRALWPAPFEPHCSGAPRSSQRNPPEECCLLWPRLELTPSQSQHSRLEGQSAATEFSYGPSAPPFLLHCLFIGRTAHQGSQVPLPSSERPAAPYFKESTFMLH